MQDVYITGLGIMSPIGTRVDSFWKALLAGTSGIKPVRKFNTDAMPIKVGAELEPLQADAFLSQEEIDSASTLTAAGIAAARQALADARLLSPLGHSQDPMLKLFYGTSNAGLNDNEKAFRRYWEEKRALSLPSEIPQYRERQVTEILPRIARALRLKGAQTMNTNTCAAGGYAISLAADQIRLGQTDIALCGGADVFAEVVFAGFINLHALAPEKCQPFERNRKGTILGEAAAMLVVESRESMERRGVRPWARLAGEGWSADACHLSAPQPQGQGLVESMQRALLSAGLPKDKIGCVLAHGTGTVSNDLAEACALREVFGEAIPPVTAIKSMLGHSQGAASAVDTLAAVLMLHHGLIPPVINYEEPDPDCSLPCVAGKARKAGLEACLVYASGFGGNNISLVLCRPGSGGRAR